jgi:predicted amidohydrolase YtcJ
VAQKFLKPSGKPVAFTNVRAFVGGDHFADGQTVVVDNGVITQVGPAATTKVPKGAHVIDGTGKTLVPGLWDSHQHVSDDASGASLMALGITSVRDPGNTNALTMARAVRRSAGELLSPRLSVRAARRQRTQHRAIRQCRHHAGRSDRDRRQGQSGRLHRDQTLWTFDPAWVPATVAEAHRLGLHVHGHPPAGMRPTDAIAAWV